MHGSQTRLAHAAGSTCCSASAPLVLGKNLDERYGEAIERYLDATKNATAGSVRSRIVLSRSSPKIAVEIPEDLFQRADKAA
ncbi:MAG: hypothetical protein QOE31_508, partial [Solirubrobacteraceae bacterium]|nr:hypothetical protein [Solirubrobacteraceae bacterium]